MSSTNSNPNFVFFLKSPSIKTIHLEPKYFRTLKAILGDIAAAPSATSTSSISQLAIAPSATSTSQQAAAQSAHRLRSKVSHLIKKQVGGGGGGGGGG